MHESVVFTVKNGKMLFLGYDTQPSFCSRQIKKRTRQVLMFLLSSI